MESLPPCKEMRQPCENPALERQKVVATCLSVLLIADVVIFLAIFMGGVISGQLQANKAVSRAAYAIAEEAAGENGRTAADYQAAMDYLEAAQQVYSASNATNLIAVFYGIATAAVFGYVAKMLRLGPDDKEKLVKEIREMTESESRANLENITKESQQLLEENRKRYQELLIETKNQVQQATDKKLNQQNDIYVSTTSCRNAAHTCLLLQSHIALIMQNGNEGLKDIPEIMSRLQVDLTNSLYDFYSYVNQQGTLPMSSDQWDVLNRSWSLAKPSVEAYIKKESNGSKSPLERAFGERDQQIIEQLCHDIDLEMRRLRRLPKSRRNQAQ